MIWQIIIDFLKLLSDFDIYIYIFFKCIILFISDCLSS